MEVVYRQGSASVAEIQDALADPPTYSAVRGSLRVLVEKGHLAYRQEGPRYVYHPTTPHEEARTSALRRVLSTFFDDSPEKVMAALLDLSSDSLSDEELARLEARIRDAREEGR